MSVKFKISDKLVKERDGATYSLDKYTLGVDYVLRKCFKGQKAVFRSDILGLSVVDPSKVEHKQEPKSLNVDLTQDKSELAELCKVKRIYPNFKWVETDLGRVWVGLKGQLLKVGQSIWVKDGQMFLGKTKPVSMTRI
jgi:hypothetical protein